MAGLQVVHVAEGYPVLQLIRWVAAHRFQKVPDVVAEGESFHDPADEPGGRVVEYRCMSRAGVPSEVIELVDGVAGALAEQFHDVEVFAVENVHRQVGGVGGHPERVVALGQTDQEARWMDAGLAGEPDQATGRDAAGFGGDDEHRIVQQRHQLLECITAGISHPLSVPARFGGESHCRNLWRGDHNGSVWPQDTAIAVAGLRYRHVPGAVPLAERLATGSQFASPVPYPTSCSPQAWASAAPLLLVRSFLGLHPHVPHRRLIVSPQLPRAWGRVTLTDLRLGDATVHIEARGQAVKVRGLPDDWQLITPQE